MKAREYNIYNRQTVMTHQALSWWLQASPQILPALAEGRAEMQEVYMRMNGCSALISTTVKACSLAALSDAVQMGVLPTNMSHLSHAFLCRRSQHPSFLACTEQDGRWLSDCEARTVSHHLSMSSDI